MRRELAALESQYAEMSAGQCYRRKARVVKPPKVDPLAPPPDPASFPAWEPRAFFRFEIVHRSRKPGSRARVGRLHTPHGVIDTPCFVPVGTNAALKGVDSEAAMRAGVQLMFCNTYHLLVHPGTAVVAKAGGLHEFMRRPAPIITDSGGFQVFSLAEVNEEEDGPELKSKTAQRFSSVGGAAQLLKVSEAGTVFRSYRDGTTISLTPESSVAAQKQLGADIIIPLDELPPYHVTRERLEASVFLSHRWMARSLRAHLADPREQAMYAVIHGGVDRELREASVGYLSSLPFDGHAIGGSLGKDRKEMHELLAWLVPLLPENKPNHVLGIADPESAHVLVPLGVDTMDSCNPTRIARHGNLLISGGTGTMRIKASVHADDHGPIDPQLETIKYSRAYLHHLFKQNEPLAASLASLHNIIEMNHLMATLRAAIMRDEV